MIQFFLGVLIGVVIAALCESMEESNRTTHIIYRGNLDKEIRKELREREDKVSYDATDTNYIHGIREEE